MLRSLLVVSMTALVAAGCPPGAGAPVDPRDPDVARDHATNAPPDRLLPDTLDPAAGDRADWKRLDVDGKGRVRVDVARSTAPGDAGTWTVRAVDADGRALGQATLSASAPTARLTWVAAGPGRFFVAIAADAGAGSYQLRWELRPPCADCKAREKCVAERCVPRNTCTPECKPGFRCSVGRCVPEPRCEGGCPAGYGCRDGRCVVDAAPSPCPAGQRWTEEGCLACDAARDAASKALDAAVARHGACKVDDDCALVPLTNACRGACFGAVAASAREAFVAEQRAIGARYCRRGSACRFEAPTCRPSYAVCDAGRCVARVGDPSRPGEPCHVVSAEAIDEGRTRLLLRLTGPAAVGDRGTIPGLGEFEVVASRDRRVDAVIALPRKDVAHLVKQGAVRCLMRRAP